MTKQFLTNCTEVSFLNKIKDSLRHCDSFSFSVSFIKKAGLVLIFPDIEAAIERGATGKVITSTYQNFTDIESLKSFLALQSNFKNFSCHLDYECFKDTGYTTVGYHTKGYLFEYDDKCEIIIGSSNITRFALLKNIEWDLAVLEEKNSQLYKEVFDEFNEKWNNTIPLSQEIIDICSRRLNYAIERWDMDYDLSAAKVKPNFMQIRALKELNRYRAMGTSRALVVAAAGSGKTYLAAFDVLNFSPKRMLYVVHEGSILMKSLETFQNVFSNQVSYGVFTGSSKEMYEDFIFATNLTMANHLDFYKKNYFDYIIIDECHHAAASTYRKIIDHFEPEFLLGLTATPERMDNQDVFELFDKNVPYELRLRDAIINDLIVPFKYYGIRDALVNYGLNKSEERKMVAQLASLEHCEFIVGQIELHRHEGKLKALAFCRNVSHARLMCENMSEYYNTAYLTGSNTVGERIRAYNDLQKDETNLEILFTVDILNEGVDIPGVNMVLFLRPTESSTVFIQQLGRGLRKYDNKEYVTILDFIGNSYKRSVQIAFALSSLANNFVLEKSLMVDLVRDDFKAIGLSKYGVEINIDQLSKEEIINSIESENFNNINYLKQDFFNFRKFIEAQTYPKHIDYLNNDCAPDLIRFLNVKIKGKKNKSYYNFLHGILKENEDAKLLPIFSQRQIDFINYLSEMLPLVRKHEYLIFECVIKRITSIKKIEKILENEIGDFSKKQSDHALHYIQHKGFLTTKEDECSLVDIELDDQFVEYLHDLLDYGLSRYSIDFGNETGFKLWNNYRIDQVQLKLLQNPGYIFLGTYYYDDIVIIFASINKGASVEEKLNYKDKFINQSTFQWESMNDLPASDLEKLNNSKHAHLFVRKVAEEYGITLPYTYVGTGVLTNPRKQESAPNQTKKGLTYLFDINLDNELPDYLQYDFGLIK